MASPTASVDVNGGEEGLAPLISSLVVVFIVLLSLLVTTVAAIVVYYILVRYILGGSTDEKYIPVRPDEQSDVDSDVYGGRKVVIPVHGHPIIYRPCAIQKERPSQKLDISSVRMLLCYIEDLSGNKNRIDEDWKTLEKYGKELPPTKVSGNKSAWSPVSIYDSNHHKPDYIVASHPPPGCVNDLWELVARKGVTTIVVLDNLKPDIQYWPNNSKKFGRFKVQLVSEHQHDCYVIRSFFIQETEGKRFSSTITQCHFLNWPHPVKTSSPTFKSLLNFRRKVNQAVNSPLLIHCSDGISHSGVYCLVDVVLNRICRGGVREVNLSATLEHLRDQKPGLVATKEQYEMAIAAIVEETQSLLND